MPSDHVLFNNWNDIHILVMVARHHSFAAAADALGLDQTTVAKRIANLELSLGRPLFTRRRSGATPTAVCRTILEDAAPMIEAVRRVESGLDKARSLPVKVTIGAPPGVLAYTLQPAFEAPASSSAHPIDVTRLRGDAMPAVSFTSDTRLADVSVLVTSEDASPSVQGAYRVRRLGAMSFRPFASRKLTQESSFRCDRFEDLRGAPLFDLKMYRHFRSLDAWSSLCGGQPRATLFETTRELHAAFLGNPAVTLVPTYSHLYERRMVPLDIAYPRMAVSLWVAAHEDTLREPQMRKVYDALGDSFRQSPWFNA